MWVPNFGERVVDCGDGVVGLGRRPLHYHRTNQGFHHNIPGTVSAKVPTNPNHLPLYSYNPQPTTHCPAALFLVLRITLLPAT